MSPWWNEGHLPTGQNAGDYHRFHPSNSFVYLISPFGCQPSLSLPVGGFRAKEVGWWEGRRSVKPKLEEKKLFLMEAMWTRFFPVFQKVQAMLKTPEMHLGKIMSVWPGFMFGDVFVFWWVCEIHCLVQFVRFFVVGSQSSKKMKYIVDLKEFSKRTHTHTHAHKTSKNFLKPFKPSREKWFVAAWA